MNDVEFIPNDKGAFAINENGERIAEMIVGISGNEMSIYHTGVVEKLQGQGIGKQLVESMTEYARANNLTVSIYCPFVKAIYSKEQEQYADIWNKEKGLEFKALK